MQIDRINPPGVHEPPGNYTHLVEIVGDTLLFIAGQVALDASGKLVGRDDLRAQAVQVFENLKTILVSAEADFSHLLKITVYVVDYSVDDLQVIREVQRRYLEEFHYPASTLIGVQSLARPEFLIEIDAVAAVR